MEAIHNINQNISSKEIKTRVGLIIAGIVTAIICVMALLYETRSANNEAANLIHTPKFVPTDLPAMMMNKIIISAIQKSR